MEAGGESEFVLAPSRFLVPFDRVMWVFPGLPDNTRWCDLVINKVCLILGAGLIFQDDMVFLLFYLA